MKIKSINKTCAIIAATLATLILSMAEAASFKLETLVPGYTGFVIVKPELRYVLGGKVRWNASLRCV